MSSLPGRRLSGSVLAVSITVALAAGCSSKGTTAPATTAAPTTAAAPPTTTAPTTTTLAPPPAPQPSPLAAASALIADWKKHDSAAAAMVATAPAVAALFATPYTTQTVISRGCSAEFLPRVCSWGPNGGGSGALYELAVLPAGPDWYVSGVTVET